MAADGRRSVPGVNETRPRRSSGREAGSESLEDPLDDWLGNVSDDDWDEGATPPARSPSSGKNTRSHMASGMAWIAR